MIEGGRGSLEGSWVAQGHFERTLSGFGGVSKSVREAGRGSGTWRGCE